VRQFFTVEICVVRNEKRRGGEEKREEKKKKTLHPYPKFRAQKMGEGKEKGEERRGRRSLRLRRLLFWAFTAIHEGKKNNERREKVLRWGRPHLGSSYTSSHPKDRRALTERGGKVERGFSATPFSSNRMDSPT